MNSNGPTWFTEGLNTEEPDATDADKLIAKAFKAYNWQNSDTGMAYAMMAQALYLRHCAAMLEDIKHLFRPTRI